LYTLEGVQEVEGVRLVKLHNPHGGNEWNGKWSDDDSSWTPSMKAAVGMTEVEDGIFYMQLEEYLQYFDHAYAASPATNFKEQAVASGRWSNRDGTASGPPKSLTYTFSDGRVESTELKYSGPQYELHLDGHGPQEVYITIMQDSKRGSRDIQHSINVFVNKANGLGRGDNIGLFESINPTGKSEDAEGKVYTTGKVKTKHYKLPATNGGDPHVIFPCTLQSGRENGYQIKVCTKNPVRVVRK